MKKAGRGKKICGSGEGVEREGRSPRSHRSPARNMTANAEEGCKAEYERI
jgi:hypothetical protein